MDQAVLFHESIEEALADVVRALGGTKAVAARLRTDMTPDAGARWLKDCLNDSRREHLTPGHVLWLLREGRAAGCHAAIQHIAAECGYAPPVPVDPEDARAALLRDYIEATKTLAKLAERIERTTTRAA